MALYEYEIGTSLEEMINVETLVGSNNAPNGAQGMALEPFSIYRTAVSGREFGDGYSHTSWKFSYLSPTMLSSLMAYVGAGNQSAPVFIKTRLQDGTYRTYQAIMHRPKVSTEMTWNGFWRDVTIRFTRLEPVEVVEINPETPEEPETPEP